MSAAKTWGLRALYVLLGAGAGFSILTFIFSISDPLKGVEEVEWPLLATADREFVPDQVKAVLGPEVKIAGFVVPLADDFKEIREFLLVPDPMSCIHAPPPPYNQMVLVHLAEPMNPQLAFGPVWVKGKLELKDGKTEFGGVAYGLAASVVTIYDGNPWKN